MGKIWMQTYTGKRVDPFNMRVEDIDIFDIAHALSNISRFTGHTMDFYSVAQHSVLVSYICHPIDAPWGLLHDATEAYLSDVSRQIKHLDIMQPYRQAEAILQNRICDHFNLSRIQPPSVKFADEVALTTEARDLFAGGQIPGWEHTEQKYRILAGTITPWLPGTAERHFLNRYRQLQSARNVERVNDESISDR